MKTELKKQRQMGGPRTSRPQSYFRDLKYREVDGSKGRKRPYVADHAQDFDPIGAVAVEHQGDPSPPMALSFCKSSKNAHIIALTDEGGYITLFNTRQRFSDSSSYQENAEKSKVFEWVAHSNAIFDLCWIKEDANMLTASGDQSIKLWDTQERKCTRALMGHTGSIKSISCHPNNQDIIVSGSRDGSFALWDTRCTKNTYQKLCISPTSIVYKAHTSPGRRRGRSGKAESMSITSVLYLKDEISVATAGAVDSVIKFWDTRHLKAPVNHACPDSELPKEEKRLHGISCLSQDQNGVFIAASCMDHRIYLYNILQLEKGPINTFSGGRTDSFFVKSAISPDASHILSGSSDGNAYIWQVGKPHLSPITLRSHDGEVTAVDWCTSEMGKVATCSDDFTVRFWDIHNSCYSNTRSPSSIRRRIMAPPTMERRRLFDDDSSYKTHDSDNFDVVSVASSTVNSPPPTRRQEVSTPELQKEKLSFGLEGKDNIERTPEAEMKSPSSVLNPPSSLKRKTIRDYFLVS